MTFSLLPSVGLSLCLPKAASLAPPTVAIRHDLHCPLKDSAVLQLASFSAVADPKLPTECEKFVDSLTAKCESANSCLHQRKFQPVLQMVQTKECHVNEILIPIDKSLVANQ